jgi:hypothetical protein
LLRVYAIRRCRGPRTRLELLNQVEERHGQYKDNREEYQRTVIKTFTAPDFDLVKNPVGNHIQKYGSDCVIKHFHYLHPKQVALSFR